MAADFFPLIAVFSSWRAVVTQAHRSALYLQSTEGSAVRQKERVWLDVYTKLCSARSQDNRKYRILSLLKYIFVISLVLKSTYSCRHLQRWIHDCLYSWIGRRRSGVALVVGLCHRLSFIGLHCELLTPKNKPPNCNCQSSDDIESCCVLILAAISGDQTKVFIHARMCAL